MELQHSCLIVSLTTMLLHCDAFILDPPKINKTVAPATNESYLYIFSVPETFGSKPFITLYMSTTRTSTYNVTAPYIGLYVNGVVKQSTLSISLNTSLRMNGTGILKKSFTIQSNTSLDVHVLIYRCFSSKTSYLQLKTSCRYEVFVEKRRYDQVSHYSSDAILVKPTGPDSNEFYIVTPSKSLNENDFAVSVPFDNTDVLIRVNCSIGEVTFDGKKYTNGQKIRKTLHSHDALQIQSNGDLTGTRVTSSKPVSVMTGNIFLNIAREYDYVADQLIPVNEWGTTYVTSKLDKNGTSVIRILASQNNTSIQIKGHSIGALNQGQFYERTVTSSTLLYIEADKPISIAQYYDLIASNGEAYPFMVAVPSIDQFVPSYTFVVPAGYETYYLTVYIETINIGGIRLDGHSVHFALRKQVRFSNLAFTAVKIAVSAGNHTLTNTATGTRFGAMLYGLKKYSSFGTFLGYSRKTATIFNH